MAKKNNRFQIAVEATPDIKNSYMPGLKALGNNSNKIELAATCVGSVDIDKAVEKKYSRSNRWDYCFSYREQVYFVEVHPASTSEVETVLKKLDWLKNWLKSDAPEVNKLKASEHPWVWIMTKGQSITSGSRQARRLAMSGIKLTSKLVLK
ncbi:hypothetical protein [Desertivirga brevis]|uniref:hypothetical protein n=1 Tax=Desertivirga brevis TaxID=2810310 RepID=UPI001A96789A|nr:hypothetical protein [Pedobacter sp. SYSU D00873]